MRNLFFLLFSANVLFGTSLALKTDVPNGKLDCTDSCRLTCSYGYVAADKNIYPLDEPDLQLKARCVDIMAVIVGGSSGTEEGLSSVEIFSTNASLKNVQIADFPYPVVSPVALWVQGKILVCGGLNTASGLYEKQCWEYNPCDDAWAPSKELTLARGKAVGVVTSDDRPWVLGGKGAGEPLTSSELRNRTTLGGLFWSSGPELDEPKSGHCGVTKKAGDVAVVTGGIKTPKAVVALDLQSGDIEFLPEMTHKRNGHACSTYTTLYGEAIIVAGGYNELYMTIDTVDLWTPQYEMWVEGPLLPGGPRAGASMVVLDRKPTLLGGDPLFGAPLASAVAFNAWTHAWVQVGAELGQARAFFGATAVPVTLLERC